MADWDGKTERREPVTMYPGQELPQGAHGWHIKKEVTLGLILGLVINLVTIVGAYYTLVGRQDLQQAEIGNLHQQDSRIREDQIDSNRQTREQFKELSIKIDKLIERAMK